MAESNKNNVANVSSAKGVKGGYIFTAPVGTALPTDYTTALPEAWKCLGYISEDGYVEALDTDSEDIKDMNGDLMASPQTSRVESAQLTLAEIKAATLKVMYLSLIHISEPTRRTPISYAVFCLKKKTTA